jgi:phytoene/squalene synthetase
MRDSRAPDAARQVRQIVAASGSTFVHGMQVLSGERRAAIFAVYAFCRTVDDIADGPGDPDGKEARLRGWHDEIDAVFRGGPRTAIGTELARAAERFSLPREEFERVIHGMEMDLSPMVGPEMAVLDRYVRCVAGAVGLLSMRIFGCWRGEPSQRFALSLATAMQLTNILRDVEEDAAQGRIYLPREMLAEARVAPEPTAVAAAPGLAHARRRLGEVARSAFASAAAEVRHHSRWRLLPALLMMGPYERLLASMEADWSRRPPRTSGWRKLVDGARCAGRVALP